MSQQGHAACKAKIVDPDYEHMTQEKSPRWSKTCYTTEILEADGCVPIYLLIPINCFVQLTNILECWSLWEIHFIGQRFHFFTRFRVILPCSFASIFTFTFTWRFWTVWFDRHCEWYTSNPTWLILSIPRAKTVVIATPRKHTHKSTRCAAQSAPHTKILIG